MSTKISAPVRVALIGAGGISAAHAAGYLKHADKIIVTALADVSKDNLDKRSAQLGNNPAQFSDWRQMLAAAGDTFDAVDICLPHHLHAAAILDAAAASKHIMCEKPMCMSLAEADQIAAAVEAAGVTYMSAHNQLFMPAVQEAKRLIDAGTIGKLIWLRSQDCFKMNWSGMAASWRGSVKTQGGGELIDTGYHPSYRLLYLAGSPVAAVRGTFGRFHVEMEGEDTASVQVRFASGVIGEIFSSWAMPLPHGTHHIHAVGTAGQLFGTGDTLWVQPDGQAKPEEKTFAPVETFDAEMEHFADCLLNGTRPIHSVGEGRAVLDLILRAAESANGWNANG